MSKRFRTRYDRLVVDTPTIGESMTDVSFSDECDINKLLNSFLHGGVIPPVYDRGPGRFADVTQYPDFASMMDKVVEARELFEDLPSSVRDRFGNNPKSFFTFASDPSNMEDLVKLGLAIPRKEEDIPVVRVVNADASLTKVPGANT